MPSIAVNRKGMIAITYYDFHFNGAEPEGLTDRGGGKQAQGEERLLPTQSWSELDFTQESFDIRKAPDAGGYFLGDYDGLAAVKYRFIAAFSVSTMTDTADLPPPPKGKSARKSLETKRHTTIHAVPRGAAWPTMPSPFVLVHLLNAEVQRVMEAHVRRASRNCLVPPAPL